MLQLGILLCCSYFTSLKQSETVGVTLVLHYTDIRKGNKTKFEILAEKLMEITDLNIFL